MRTHMFNIHSFTIIQMLLLTGCGVKGPPLPPFPSTPQKMEREDEKKLSRPSPQPSSSPPLSSK
jgi:predicted small lipoprotein YifL